MRRLWWSSDLPLFFHTSAVNGMPEGWSLDDAVVLAGELKRISGSATANVPKKRQPGFQVPYAERVREDVGMATMAVGLITHPQQAEDILEHDPTNLIAIGREALMNPMWALRDVRMLGADPDFAAWPEQSGWWLAGRERTSDFYQPDIDAS